MEIVSQNIYEIGMFDIIFQTLTFVLRKRKTYLCKVNITVSYRIKQFIVSDNAYTFYIVSRYAGSHDK